MKQAARLFVQPWALTLTRPFKEGLAMAASKSTIPTVSGIYQIRCMLNGKIYVGSAVNLRRRWDLHCRSLSKSNHHSKHLQRAWTKHGADQFVFEVLELVPEKTMLIPVEQSYIDQLKPFGRKGYNICPTAGSCLGKKATRKTKKKLSAARKGQKKSESHRAALAEHLKRFTQNWKGRKHKKETLVKMSEVQKGHPVSDHVREAVSKANASREVTQQQRSKASAQLKGRKLPPFSAEHRANMSAARKGRKLTPEHRARISASVKKAKNKKDLN